MRTDLDHLPDAKRRDLERARQILFEEFEAVTRNRSHAHIKNGRILKVILFGSFARGDWAPSGATPSSRSLSAFVAVSRPAEQQGGVAPSGPKPWNETSPTQP